MDLPKARSAPDKAAIERPIAAADWLDERRIVERFPMNDERISRTNEFSVYELYGLTEEKIEIVEPPE